MIKLDRVTLIDINSVDPEISVKSLLYSIKDIEFSRVILFSHRKPHNLQKPIEYIEINKINSLEDYSRFCIEELTKYIDTDFVINCQNDGFIINPHLWTDEFLEYDYIGAPWAPNTEWAKVNRVGNGGFCLKSKKFLDLCSNIEYRGGHDDVVVTNEYYNYFTKFGIKYAPVEVAMKFSLEMKIPECEYNLNNCFGFHGKGISWHHLGEGEMFKEKLNLIRKNNLVLQNNVGVEDINDFYRNKIIGYEKEELKDFLRNKIGVSDTNYFLSNYKGNLEVQQIPEEYVNLLIFFKNNNINRYLELGVANGGSFFMNSIFLQKTADIIHCVDCLAYKDVPWVGQTAEKIQSKVDRLKEYFPEKKIQFYNMSTDNFFKQNSQEYDCIFIDADHDYEGVMKDYVNSLKFIRKDGWIIFHDIQNYNTGVKDCWTEVSKNYSTKYEFCHPISSNCGIGIIQIK